MEYFEDLVTSGFIRITVPPEYPYVMLVAGLVAFEVLLVGFFGPGAIRGKVFNK